MSLLCLCVIENIQKREIFLYTQQIERLAKYYNCGIKYGVDWSEPITSCIKNDSLIINILDSPESDNCEMFLLPDGWYSNGQTNKLDFRERMKFLQDISNIFINKKYPINFYLGESGADLEEFLDVALKSKDLADYLTNTVGVYGVDNGMHISITS